MTSTSTHSNGQVQFLVPEGLHHNPAFSNVVAVSGPVKTVYVGGQNAVDADGEIIGKGDIAAQTRQVFANLQTALKAAGATLDDVIKWNLYVLEGQPIGAGYAAAQEFLGNRPNPPLITAAFVSALAHPDFLLELEAVAVIPEK
jgi:enamine deaminase RidA (YjgF/YER057c/UK114 family)